MLSRFGAVINRESVRDSGARRCRRALGCRRARELGKVTCFGDYCGTMPAERLDFSPWPRAGVLLDLIVEELMYERGIKGLDVGRVDRCIVRRWIQIGDGRIMKKAFGCAVDEAYCLSVRLEWECGYGKWTKRIGRGLSLYTRMDRSAGPLFFLKYSE